MAITFTADDRGVQQALHDKIARLTRPRPLLLSIGAHLEESTKMRFREAKAPDGTRWAPNTRVTIERYLGERGGYGKTGKINAKGTALATAKQPLTGATRLLGTQIVHQADDSVLQVGSNRIYAAVQQFGATQGSLGGGAPWGDIPARPYLGLSAQDRSWMLEEIAEYLE
jgi:phage virion morphogenesis protein